MTQGLTFLGAQAKVSSNMVGWLVARWASSSSCVWKAMLSSCHPPPSSPPSSTPTPPPPPSSSANFSLRVLLLLQKKEILKRKKYFFYKEMQLQTEVGKRKPLWGKSEEVKVGQKKFILCKKVKVRREKIFASAGSERKSTWRTRLWNNYHPIGWLVMPLQKHGNKAPNQE